MNMLNFAARQINFSLKYSWSPWKYDKNDNSNLGPPEHKTSWSWIWSYQFYVVMLHDAHKTAHTYQISLDQTHSTLSIELLELFGLRIVYTHV